MTRQERDDLKADINRQEPTFLQRDKHKGFICPVPDCNSGSGKNGTGITRDKKTQRFHCFSCGMTEDVIGLWAISRGMTCNEDYIRVLETCAEYYGFYYPKYNDTTPPTAEEIAKWEAEQAKRREAMQAKREKDAMESAKLDAQKEASRQRAKEIYDNAEPVKELRGYLARKIVGASDGVKRGFYHNSKCTPSEMGAYIIPVLNILTGEFQGLQYLLDSSVTNNESGKEISKPFHFGTITKNGYFQITPPKDNADCIFIAEGYATGYTVAEIAETAELNATVLIAFDCGNLPNVYNALCTQQPQAQIAVAYDNDLKADGKPNPGKEALKACKGAFAVGLSDEDAMKCGSDWNDFVNYEITEQMNQYKNPEFVTDTDEQASYRATARNEAQKGAVRIAAQIMLEQLTTQKEQKAAAASEQIAPADNTTPNDGTLTETTAHIDYDIWGFEDIEDIDEKPLEWLISGIFPRIGTAAIVAPRGSGKSWLVLDAAMSIACGLPDWHGRAITTYNGSDTVVYICGEGAGNIKSRLNIWREYHSTRADIQKPKFKKTKNIPRFTPLTREAMSREIRKYNVKPCLVILDTLSCFFEGDENKTVDMNSFTHEMTLLAQEYQCCVVTVHHTGHAAENQNRERGSIALSSNVDVFSILETCKYNNGLAYTLTQDKNRYAPKEENTISLKVEKIESALYCRQDGKPETALIPVDVIRDAPYTGSDEPQPTRKQKRWLEYIASACKVIDNTGNPFAATRFDFKHVALSDVEAIAKAHSLKYEQSRAYGVLDDLEENGLIAYHKQDGKTLIEILHRATIIELNGRPTDGQVSTQDDTTKRDTSLIFDPLKSRATTSRANALKGK